MPSLNKTSELGLNQWSGSDYPKRDDFNNDNLIVDNAIKDLRKRIAGSLSDLKALKALDTTGMADNILIAIKALGIYRLDKTSMLAANDTSIIQPNEGTGRWINILYDANNYTDIKTDAIMDILQKGAVINPPINFGMNNKITIPEGGTSVQPKFTFQGKHSINLLGKDGNCEDISKWNTLAGATLTIDTTNKVFGNSGIKISSNSTATWGTATIDISNRIDKNKYFCLSAYLKNSTAIDAIIGILDSSPSTIKCSATTNSSKFNRIFVKLAPSELANVKYIGVGMDCRTGSSHDIYFDGVMLEEITADQYNDVNYVPTPYHDSYSCLKNPYIEIRHDNLIRNGNCEEGIAWWEFYNTIISSQFSVSNGKFSLMNLTQWQGVVQKVHVRPNTTYQLIGNSSNSSLIITANKIDGTWIGSANGHVTTDATTTDIYIEVINPTLSTISATFDHIMLIESDTLPTEYKPCKNERVVLEGDFADGDTVTYQAGKIEGQKNWLHKTLYGKDYPWMMWGYFTGYKSIRYNHNGIYNNAGGTVNIVAKYDGKILPYADGNALTFGDMFNVDTLNTYITVSNFDTGWTDSIQPNDNEVKAFMNGWKAIWNNGTRYTAWISNDWDANMPAGAIHTTASALTAANQKVLNVMDSSIFSAGDLAIYRCSDSYWRVNTILSITGNQLNLSDNIPVSINTGAIVMKSDNGTTNTSMLNYCMNNVAPGYEGYQLHYKLQNSVPITDENCTVKGDILTFTEGNNYIYIDSGQVLGEQASPVYDGSNLYYINSIYSPVVASIFKNKAEDIIQFYKNGTPNIQVWTKDNSGTNTYGNSRLYTAPANVDTKASYTVDYKILATIAPLLGSMFCSYNTAVFEAINELEEAIKSRQVHDGILDNIVDASLYEVKPYGYHICSRYMQYGALYIEVIVPFKPKKSIPRITINTLKILVGSSAAGVDTTSKFMISSLSWFGDNLLRLTCYTLDSATITAVNQYGVELGTVNIIADCR